MRPFVMNGRVWRVVGVKPGDPRLIDRTGNLRVATTDPVTNTIAILDTLAPPLLDRVMVHEIAHAATISHGLLGPLRAVLPSEYHVFVEEWAAQLVELHSLEAVQAASRALGRQVCIEGRCYE